MKEHPILFNGEMVRAILDGRKTQTRRVIKPQPLWVADPSIPFKTNDCDPKGIIKCPYGRRGDRLYVRETWCEEWDNDNDCFYDPPRALYRADGNIVDHVDGPDYSPWRASIHMPRWASRLTLDVTDVREERLHDISEGDIKAEGFGERHLNKVGLYYAFGRTWNAINAKRGFGWDENPWVWVVEFKRVEEK